MVDDVQWRLFLFLFTKDIGVAQDHEAHLGPDESLAEMTDTHQQSPRTYGFVGEAGGTCGDGATAQIV